MKTTIIVTPFLETGFSVSINGEQSATFADGGVACAAWAEQILRVRELEHVIEKHAASLHAMTPEQVSQMDAGRVRDMASRLMVLAGLDQ